MIVSDHSRPDVTPTSRTNCIPLIVCNFYLAASTDGNNMSRNQLMPCHNELYTGRDDYLEKLRLWFHPRGPNPVPEGPSLFTGWRCWKDADMSEVRRRLFRTVSVNHLCHVGCSLMILDRFWRIFWLDATTAETLELSMRDIATDPDADIRG